MHHMLLLYSPRSRHSRRTITIDVITVIVNQFQRQCSNPGHRVSQRRSVGDPLGLQSTPTPSCLSIHTLSTHPLSLSHPLTHTPSNTPPPYFYLPFSPPPPSPRTSLTHTPNAHTHLTQEVPMDLRSCKQSSQTQTRYVRTGLDTETGLGTETWLDQTMIISDSS